MDALLPPLVAAFLAEWGDKTQLLAVMLALRVRRVNTVLIGIAAAVLLNSLLSAFAGSLLAGLITFRALTLMTGLALISAGVGALLPQKPPRLETRGAGGVLFASFFAFGVLQFGDKTQFVTAALAGRANSIWLTGFGAALGTMLAIIPAAMMAERLSAVLPLRAIRTVSGSVLLIAGAVVAITALRLL